jgi:RecA-family ATPase
MFSTTTRAELIGPTGAGKSTLLLAWAFSMAAGVDFLHWKAIKPARRILYFDGEMSARLARKRLEEAAQRHGSVPENLIYINRDDFPDLPPLNTRKASSTLTA